MIDTAALLQRLFEADPAAPDYYDTAPGYELNSALGWPPWWPPANEAWAAPEPPGTWHGPNGAWQAAREHLERLHAEYRATA